MSARRQEAVEPGMRVADVGAGTGVFSMLLSDAVGPDGVVYTEEVVDRFARYTAERAAANHDFHDSYALHFRRVEAR